MLLLIFYRCIHPSTGAHVRSTRAQAEHIMIISVSISSGVVLRVCRSPLPCCLICVRIMGCKRKQQDTFLLPFSRLLVRVHGLPFAVFSYGYPVARMIEVVKRVHPLGCA